MIDYDKEKSKRLAHEGQDDQEGSGGKSGSGGQGGTIEFHDFITIGRDKISPADEKLLLAQHRDLSSAQIEKQKILREQRNSQKENRTLGNQYGAGQNSRESDFLRHPILSEAAEFDGVDPQVNLDPTIYEADTNDDKKQELTYQHQLRMGLQNQPKFTPPKPSPF